MRAEIENKELQVEDQDELESYEQKIMYTQTIKMKITIKNYNNNIGSFFKQIEGILVELKTKETVKQYLVEWTSRMIKQKCCLKQKHIEFLNVITKQHKEQKEGLKYQEVVQLQNEYQQLKGKYEFQQNQLDSYKEALERSEQQLSKQIDQQQIQVNEYEEQPKSANSVFDGSINTDSDCKMEMKIIKNFDYSQFD